MSMINLGMALRPQSQVVQSPQEIQSLWQSQLATAKADYDQKMQRGTSPAMQRYTAQNPGYAAQRPRKQAGYLSDYNEEVAQANSQFGAVLPTMMAAQQQQQSAYNAQLAGTPGGVLPTVAQQGTQDPTAAMPWGQPWSTPGFGNPGSLGGLGGFNPNPWGGMGQGGQSNQLQQDGWGSVFSGNNPWSRA